MRTVCPNCNEIVSFPDYVKDFEHQCNSGVAALDQEDHPKISDPKYNLLGLENDLGVRAQVEGEKYTKLSPRGNRLSTHSQRQHYEFIELDR